MVNRTVRAEQIYIRQKYAIDTKVYLFTSLTILTELKSEFIQLYLLTFLCESDRFLGHTEGNKSECFFIETQCRPSLLFLPVSLPLSL